jgi:hypothetical protein
MNLEKEHTYGASHRLGYILESYTRGFIHLADLKSTKKNTGFYPNYLPSDYFIPRGAALGINARP